VPGTVGIFTVKNRTVKSSRIAPLALGCVLTFVALAGAGCRREIGDDCQTSVDCDPNGTRNCDLSQPGGYCTIFGCDETSCPSGSTCIRYFPEQFLTKTCNVSCEDIPACNAGAGCVAPDGVPVPATCPACPTNADGSAICANGPTNDCDADELCLETNKCVRRALEHRACAKVCSSGGDCRDGYQCRDSNSPGSMVLATSPTITTKFCAPAPKTTP
jgi:hypothetical protein